MGNSILIRRLIYILLAVLGICFLLMFSQIRGLIILFGEYYIVHRNLNDEIWNGIILRSVFIMLLFVVSIFIHLMVLRHIINTKWKRIAFFVLIVSLMLRLVNLNNPILEMHGFRQSQTAITVQSYINEGLSVFNYKTPVFAPPWTVPFEFPTYQTSAFFIYKILELFAFTNLDISLRVCSIIYFYGGLLFLYLLSSRLFSSNKLSVFIAFFYLFLPFNIYWSRTSMIEFCAVFFSLGYTYFFYVFLKRDNISFFFLSILFGIFAYLTKITTILPYCFFLSYFVIKYLVLHLRSENKINSKAKYTFQIILVVFLPLILGILWTKYTDQIKVLSGVEGLTSSGLKNWNFGTFSQKFNIANWGGVFSWIKQIIPLEIPIVTLAFLPFLVMKFKYFSVVVLSLIGSLLTIFVFFNLYYVHDYYFCSIVPFICIITGYFVYYIFQQTPFTLKQKYCLFIFWFLFYGWGQWKNTPYISALFSSANIHNEFISMTSYIKNHTNQNDLIMVFDYDWDPSIAYYSNRKALMRPNWDWRERKDLDEFAKNYELAIMRSGNDKVNAARLSKLQNFVLERRVWIWDIYRRFNKKNILSSTRISIPTDITLLNTNDIVFLKETTDGLIIRCGSADPFVIIPTEFIYAISETRPYVEIKYSNSHTGILQIFYDFDGIGFSEENSTGHYPVSITSDATAIIPIYRWSRESKLQAIRIDPPNGSTFTLNEINIISME
jgi:hypothetical protein